MEKYKAIITELKDSVKQIENYQEEAKNIIKIIGNEAQFSNNQLIEHSLKLDELKERILEYTKDYNAKIDEVSKGVSNEFKEQIDKNMLMVKDELKSETSEALIMITKTFNEVYSSLNNERLELIESLNKSLELQTKEGILVQEIKDELQEKNDNLTEITIQAKENVQTHYDAILAIKEEVDILKKNFELRYVYDKKRIILTSVFSFVMLLLVAITVITSIYMFMYYSKFIFFPNRTHTLLIGISLILLAVVLLSMIVFILIKPPTFLRINKKRGRKNEKK